MIEKVKKWIINFLKQGVSPQKLALAVAFGVTLGVFPMLGTTSLLCLGAALLFRLNIPAIQAINYIMYPLQLLLFIPFFKIGTSIFSSSSFNYSLSDITSMLAEHPLQTIADLFVMNMYAILLWLLISPVLFSVFYFGCRKLFLFIQAKMSKTEVIANEQG